MRQEVGLWIDFRHAVIVTLFDQEEKIARITASSEQPVLDSESDDESGAVKQHKFFYTHLSKYFDEIIAYLQDADSLLMLGPGEAKSELLRRVTSHEILPTDSIVIKSAGKMTDDQIVAETRQHFGEHNPV